MISASEEITKEKWPLHSGEEMGHKEAQEITQAIQQNFDSLGLMLKAAKERKAWKALGYRDFGSYCNNEFDKSKSRAYQIIEEAEIAQTLRNLAPAGLNIPANSHLRLLKDLSTDKQIEAIQYAEDLAKATEGKKPTKLQIQLAVEKISGNKPEQLKHSLSELGFSKGAEILITRGANTGSRGLIKRLDKEGQIWVELHHGNSLSIPYDATSLRILNDSEKPQKRAWVGTTDIGDKVLIFSRGLENQIGEIAIRINEKMAGIKVNGKIIELPYAELEVLEVVHEEPDEQSDVLSNEQLIILIKTQLITCGNQADKARLAETIISNIWQMISPEEKEKIKNLDDTLRKYKKANDDLFSINGELRESLLAYHREEAKLQKRLEEAEEIISQMVSKVPIDSKLDATLDAVVDTTLDAKTPSEMATADSVENDRQARIDRKTHTILQQIKEAEESLKKATTIRNKKELKNDLAKLHVNLKDIRLFATLKLHQTVYHFSPKYSGKIVDFWFSEVGEPRAGIEWQITEGKTSKIYEPMYAISTETHSPQLDVEAEEYDKSTTASVTQHTLDTTPDTTQWRQKIKKEIEIIDKKREGATRKESEKLSKQIDRLCAQLFELDYFEKIEIGRLVTKKRYPEVLGKVTGLSFSTGGMPQVWVHWLEHNLTDTNSVSVLDFNPEIQSETEQW